MSSYSQDLRDRVLSALEQDQSAEKISARFEVSRSWVYLVKARYRLGERGSRQVGGYRVSRLAGKEAQIRKWIQQTPDLSLAALCERLQKQNGIALKTTALWHQLDRWGLTYKKNVARQRARSGGRAPSPGAMAQPTARP
jgi:transposase